MVFNQWISLACLGYCFFISNTFKKSQITLNMYNCTVKEIYTYISFVMYHEMLVIEKLYYINFFLNLKFKSSFNPIYIVISLEYKNLVAS